MKKNNFFNVIFIQKQNIINPLSLYKIWLEIINISSIKFIIIIMNNTSWQQKQQNEG